MYDDSIGRGERQARALVTVVLLIEAIWIFFHKYLPLDASLWSLQADAIRLHFSGAKDGLQIIPLPAANVLVPFISGLLSFLLSGEVVIRLLAVIVGFFLRGMAMISMLRSLRVREATVYFLVPVIVWSGVFFIGNIPYLIGETLAIALVSFFLRQDRPQSFVYYILMVGFAIVALCHALAFFAVALITITVANEQRRSVHLSQGWLSNFNRVVGLVIPGCVILLLRFIAPSPVFMLSTSGFLPATAPAHFLMALAVTPHINEAAFPGSDILAALVSGVAVLLALVSLVRAFILPMEEVSWQSKSSKSAGAILLVVAILGYFLYSIGVETSAFIWMALFFVIAASYSRGPAVRRGAVDRMLRSFGFILMIVSGALNGLGTNRGSEASFELRERAVHLIEGEYQAAKENDHLDSLDIRAVIDSVVVATQATGIFPSISYSLTAPVYLYSKGTILNRPGLYQPRAGWLEHADGKPLLSPANKLPFSGPIEFFDRHVRILAMLPSGSTNSANFGPYAHGLTDTTGGMFVKAKASFYFGIGKLQSEHQSGLALR